MAWRLPPKGRRPREHPGEKVGKGVTCLSDVTQDQSGEWGMGGYRAEGVSLPMRADIGAPKVGTVTELSPCLNRSIFQVHIWSVPCSEALYGDRR